MNMQMIGFFHSIKIQELQNHIRVVVGICSYRGLYFPCNLKTIHAKHIYYIVGMPFELSWTLPWGYT